MYPLRVTVIPDDILAELFLACLPCVEEGWPTEAAGGHEKRWETVGQNRHPSVDLSHVCRRWRRVALGTPRLWVQADICIPSFPDSKDRIRRLTQLVEAMTRRSAACTMSFKVKVAWEDRGFKWTVPTGILAPFKKLFQEFVDAVCASSARWRCFSLSGDFDGEAHGDAVIKFLDAIAGPLPALSYVFIDAEFASQRHPTRIIRPLIAAPALQSVAILQPYGLLKDLPVAAWSHLKNLTLGSWKRASGKGIQNIGMHSHTALCLLKSLRSLVHLDMHMDHVAPNEAEEYSLANITVEPVFLPHLQSLSLKGAAVAPGFATAVTLPSLEVLRFTSLRIMDRERQEAGLLECVSCFGCTITGFELDVVDFSEAFVVACAESLMQITTLTIGELPPRRRSDCHQAATRFMPQYYILLPRGGEPPQYIPPNCILVSFLRHLASPIEHQIPNFNPRGYRAPHLQNISLSWQTSPRGLVQAIVDLVLARSGRSAEQNNIPPLKFSAHLSSGFGSNIDIRRELVNRGIDLESLDLQLHISSNPLPSYTLPSTMS